MLSIFLNSISGILIILIIIALGFVLTRRGWFNDQSAKLIAKIVTQIALPCYMLATITGKFTAPLLLRTLPDLRFPVVSMIILFALSIVVAQVLRIRKYHRGLFESMFFNSNTVFIGLPINMALFGPKSLPYVLVYYMANTTFFWTLGVFLIQRDGNRNAKFSLKQAVRKVLSPPLLGFILAVILVLLHGEFRWLVIPNFLNTDFEYIGGLTIPLSMIFIGIEIGKSNLRSFKFSRRNWGILLGRFLCAPVLMSLLVIFTGMPLLMKQVFIIQAAMPVMTNAPVVSDLYDADAKYASISVTETTVLSLIVIPIIMILVQQL